MELQQAEDQIKDLKLQANTTQIKFQEQLQARENMHLQLDVIQSRDSPEKQPELLRQEVVEDEA